jgi:hypothetical protein
MKDKLEAIRQACIEANPEIVELKFGCEIEWKGERAFLTGDTYVLGDVAGGSAVQKKFWVANRSIRGVDSFREGNGDWGIIGRPIRLCDVLLAIDKSVVKEAYSFKMYANGYMWLENIPDGGTRQDAIYNLRADDLTQQSEECISFLYELLKPRV